MAPSSAAFRFRLAADVRYSDVDAAGHVHHARALVFFEEARAAYWRDVVGRASIDDIDYVIAEATVRWHARIEWPATLEVCARVSAVGRKHFHMEYEVRSRAGERLVTGHTVQVMYDYAARSSKPVPPEVRAAIAAFEGPLAGDADAGVAHEVHGL